VSFDYINGFHDSANAIALVVSTRVLSPRQALAMAASLNFLGAFISLGVAKTISSGIVHTAAITQAVVVAALIGAIVWNLVTWFFGIPSSSSHALVGGLVGAGLVHGGIVALDLWQLTTKVLIPIVAAPVLGLLVGYAFMVGLTWLVYRGTPDRVNKIFRRLQLCTSAATALSHGTNDAQKSMGIITLALLVQAQAGGWPWPRLLPGSDLLPPTWVIVACAVAMALGTAAGGWKIIHTMGSRIFRVTPIHAVATDLSASFVLQTAAHFGMPVSTTHVIVASLMGVGATRRLSAVRWGVAGNIITAWILTIPAAAGVAALSYCALRIALGHA